MGNSEGTLTQEGINVDYSKGQVHEDWTMCPGKLNETPITVFSAAHPSSSRKRPFMEKALQWSKILRHPSLLRYIYGGCGNEVVVVTEEATPLLQLNVEKMAPLQVTTGIFSIVEALIFLHDKAGISHNNVCASSIFVTPDGTWKLWGMEYLCSFGDLTKDHLTRINPYCHPQSIPPDELGSISPSYQHSRDSFALGTFIKQFAEPVMKDVSHFDEFVKILGEESLSKDWTKRPRMISLSSHSLFLHDFIQLRNKIANILLLPATERDSLLRCLPTRLRVYDEELVASTMGALLVSHATMLIPGSDVHLMPYVLKPKSDENPDGLFSNEHYTNHLLMPLLNLFSVHDCTIRKILLQHFKDYSNLISNQCLTDNILPELLLGMKDKDEQLVSITLIALAHLISILGADTVVGQNREMIFATAKPKSDIPKTLVTKSIAKRKENINLPLKMSCSSPKELCSSSPENVFASPSTSSKILIRSPPDGGEKEEVLSTQSKITNEEEKIQPIDVSTNDKSINIDNVPLVAQDFISHNRPLTHETNVDIDGSCSDEWSDWEEMLDQSVPDINGVLQVMTPEKEYIGSMAFHHDRKHSLSRNSFVQKLDSTDKESCNISNKDSKPKNRTFSLGEEYDIMSLNVKKIPDAELSLFESIAPKLSTNSFDLEKMLVEATNKTSRGKSLSLSDTLAGLEFGKTDEGDGWDDDKEDKIFDDIDFKKSKDFKHDIFARSEPINFSNDKRTIEKSIVKPKSLEGDASKHIIGIKKIEMALQDDWEGEWS